ncbi:uncharacterized protein LOC131490342 [Neofelis nebulosa]|uniref:uncharacterized protein LOC131490342 n=1 Tax=Neofelis nebulosa TaxID=61452 RepID=UPI00272CFBA5|nr:uncharacterized protein LOC131490342 [Neofelis nebulosa]
MPGNDVTGSHSSVRTTTKQCSGNPRQLLSKCQRQPGPKSLKGTKLEDFVLYLSRPHFPQALPGTWQQVTWQPSPCKMASGIISENRWMHFFKAGCISPHPPHLHTPPLPPPAKRLEKKVLLAGSPTLECRLVAKLGTSARYLEIRGSAPRLNATRTKELLLTSHLQSPPGHRQDHFNKPGSETPIVRNLQLATGFHHNLLFCKIKDFEGEGLRLWTP